MSQEIEALAGLDGPAETEPWCEAVRSVSQLIGNKKCSTDLPHFADKVKALPDASTESLVSRLETTTDPLLLWSLHLELDRRDIPPCLRWPANLDTPQNEFITFSADLLWFTKRNLFHETRFRGWRGLFLNKPASYKWHVTAHRQFLFVARRCGLAHWCSKGLALSDAQRQPLMLLPTRDMVTDRRQLKPELFATTRERLLSWSMAHRDRSGKYAPEVIAERRAKLWRVFILSGRDYTLTTRNWSKLTGETLSRQAVTKQVDSVFDVLNGLP